MRGQTAPSAPADPDAYLRREMTVQILRTASWHWVPHIGVALLVSGRLASTSPWAPPAAWAAALSVIVFVQSIRSRWALRAGQGHRALARGLLWFQITSALVGAVWAYLGFALFPDELYDQVFVTLAIGGASLAGVGMLHMSIMAQSLALGPALVFLGISHVLAGGPNGLVVGVLVWIFFGMMTILGLQLNGFTRQRIILQRDKDQLIDDLQRQTQALDEARRSEQHANAAKTNFIAHASHDLRQPLHAMGLFLEALPERFDSPSVDRSMGQIRSSQRQLSELFDSLMDVSVIEAQQVEVRPVAVALGPLFDAVVAEFRPLAEAQGAPLGRVETTQYVQADPQLLRRMIRNLVSNAINHGHGARVLLGCRRAAGRVMVEVHDGGPGISADDQARVFQEFSRLEANDGEHRAPGLGLGLTIVARLAALQGLSVALRSRPGHGSVFSIRGLVSVEAPSSDQTETARTEVGPDLVRRILIVDDDVKVREATAALLTKWGFWVEVSPGLSPDQATPDILLCDYDLGTGVDGFAVIRAAQDQFGPGLQAALLTGSSEPHVQSRASEHGLPLLRKPVRPAQLRSAILLMETRLGASTEP